jgi:streptogramin lyase
MSSMLFVQYDRAACAGARRRPTPTSNHRRRRPARRLSRRAGRPPHRLLGVAVLALALVVVGVVAVPARSGPIDYDEFTDASIDQPRFVAMGPDGALWFTATGSDRVGTVTADGVVVTYDHAQVDAPSNITLGPDGALWFISAGNDRIGRITTAGVITTFPATGLTDLRGITTGADGNLWFLAEGQGALGRMTPAGVVTPFPNAAIDDPSEIAAGPDGFLFFTNTGGDTIGRVTTGGAFVFYGEVFLDAPRGIVAGPDGHMWFTSPGSDRVGRIRSDGLVTTFPTGIDQPARIGVGPDGDDLWVTSTTAGTFARVSVGGYVLELVNFPPGLVGIVGDPAGAVWMASRDTDSILRYLTEPGPAAVGRFVQHADPSGLLDGPYELTTHTDGRVWFADINGGRIGRVDDGVIRTFTGADVSFPVDVASGEDGNVWFTSSGNGRIGSITSGGGIATVVDPQGEVAEPWAITPGPDGNLWFTDVGNNRIGRLDPDTDNITTFTDGGIDVPQDIVTGPDGNLWFTSTGTNAIGRITPAGQITMFTDPQGEVLQPIGIAVGPDDAIWFTNAVSEGRIGRLDPGSGDFEVFLDPFGVLQEPMNLTVGSDGRFWIAADDQIMRMDTTGTFVQYDATYGLTGDPYGITTGPDGNVWYSEPFDSFVASITPGPRFGDVGFTHSFYDEIDWMGAEGISTGFQPGPTYRPSDAVTRQAMSAFLYRLAGEPAFSPPSSPTFVDVADTHPFFAEIEWMADEGITTGFAGGLFKPGNAVTREAMSAFMYRFARAPVFVPPASPTFVDVGTGHAFFGEIEWMADEGITTGFPGGLYKPAQAVTRQAMSAFMYRYEAFVGTPA